MTSRRNNRRIYKVLFHSQGKVYELFARHVYSGDLYGFIQVEELIFGETSGLLIDPAQERLQGEFGGVKRSFIPIHAIIRIDEVEKEGVSKIRGEGESNVAAFPPAALAPGKRPPGKE
ncbi:MAG TPA: DUF1820 family protein [Candidatus Competibacteraceae bacterium]|nr:DUF1820 family protein [Candidatus Competibacteraceae bacterium]